MPYVSRVGPTRMVAEPGALAVLSGQVPGSAFIITGKTAWDRAGVGLEKAFTEGSNEWEVAIVGRECYEDLAAELAARANAFDWVIGVGGGKVMDLSKLVAEIAQRPVVLVPTTPATCASWTSLSIVYDAKGENPVGRELTHGPDLLVLDMDILATAPARHLASGILDALAKWYEIGSAADAKARREPGVHASLGIAKICRDTLFRLGPDAVGSLRSGRGDAEALKQTVWASIVLPGLCSGLVGERHRFSIAHSFYNHLTMIPTARLGSMHGEQVAFGLVVQMLLLSPVHPEIEDFLDLRSRLGAPMTLAQLGVGSDSETMLRHVAAAIMNEPGISTLPFDVTETKLLDAIHQADRIGELRSRN